MKRKTGVYVMQVAAMLTGLHPQTLRKYERVGLVSPVRINTLRLYSDEDIAQCRLIRRLVDEMGLNLAGVELALNLEQRLQKLKKRIVEDESANQKGNLALIEEMLEILGED
ncbi:MAG: MerR family transcriptional regulator [Dehalococcoidales bacterium]|jgi:MerR family transcriptional regulator/heat shock protein HspR|nr:MerR family transcriptional regulator [Dehalococcoidales bacterium]MDD4323126.1 MerR family transcriptional regulator [Dehalococcoidales bacterium]MDD4794847.1 MerR family transcriptional regulator [Dehalococcoidales bacterium]MDD5122127.1 MerR family transcriptional regulator [Dehalococcoidales bacterium]MDD5499067.1 MerR family transcriptional regulator [Dehalococcoidales bacterium]